VRHVRAAVCAVLLALLGLLAVISPAAPAQELTLSVAISMKEAVEAIGRGFADSRGGVVLRYNFGASGDLARQIEAGAPVDVFISAAERQMDELAAKGLVEPDARRVFARNVVVAITPMDSPIALTQAADLLQPRVRRIVVGNPKTVPVGQYSERCLRALGLWGRLQPKLVFAENVRQALDYVARGEVDAGFVYATDAAIRPRDVRVAFRPVEETYGPVTYPAAVVRDSKHATLARAFVEALTGADAQRVLQRLGFVPPPSGAR
jgi:molybdate transport system substrate-binding protein